MPRKYIAILFITVAYAILLGHSIVPHHHHETEQELSEHHQSGHHHSSSGHHNSGNHHEDENNWDLSHVFSHVMHAEDGFTFTPNHSIGNALSEQISFFIAVLPPDFSFWKFPVTNRLHEPPEVSLICSSPHSLSSGLRAPPSIS